MMTYADIRSAAPINPGVARAALEQSEKRLADIVEVRKASDAKQTSLFSAYIGFTMAICGIGAALAQKPEFAAFSGVFFAAAAPFGCGALLFLVGLWPTTSAYLGAYPGDWLQRDLLSSSGDENLAIMQADMVVNIAGRLVTAERDIRRKQLLSMAGMVFGLAGMIIFAATLLTLPRG